MTGRAGSSYTDEVTYGSHIIAFQVVPADRRTLGISVYPDGHVEVRAPIEAEAEKVRDRVQRRARWIRRQQRRFAAFVAPIPEKEYVAGETHRYLGGQYRIKINPVEAGEEEGVKLMGRFFEVYTTKPKEPEHTRALLERWYAQKAQQHLRSRFENGVSEMRRYGIEAPELVIRKMKRRWGSCTPSRRIMLNPWLVLAPTYCIDYVITHELCHLLHPHHGPDFYKLLSTVMPDWQRRKERLEQVQY